MLACFIGESEGSNPVQNLEVETNNFDQWLSEFKS